MYVLYMCHDNVICWTDRQWDFLLFADARRTQALLNRMDTDKMARSLWTCDKELNSKQQEAIREALKNHFQLIQGPPGYH